MVWGVLASPARRYFRRQEYHDSCGPRKDPASPGATILPPVPGGTTILGGQGPCVSRATIFPPPGIPRFLRADLFLAEKDPPAPRGGVPLAKGPEGHYGLGDPAATFDGIRDRRRTPAES